MSLLSPAVPSPEASVNLRSAIIANSSVATSGIKDQAVAHKSAAVSDSSSHRATADSIVDAADTDDAPSCCTQLESEELCEAPSRVPSIVISTTLQAPTSHNTTDTTQSPRKPPNHHTSTSHQQHTAGRRLNVASCHRSPSPRLSRKSSIQGFGAETLRTQVHARLSEGKERRRRSVNGSRSDRRATSATNFTHLQLVPVPAPATASTSSLHHQQGCSHHVHTKMPGASRRGSRSVSSLSTASSTGHNSWRVGSTRASSSELGHQRPQLSLSPSLSPSRSHGRVLRHHSGGSRRQSLVKQHRSHGNLLADSARKAHSNGEPRRPSSAATPRRSGSKPAHLVFSNTDQSCLGPALPLCEEDDDDDDVVFEEEHEPSEEVGEVDEGTRSLLPLASTKVEPRASLARSISPQRKSIDSEMGSNDGAGHDLECNCICQEAAHAANKELAHTTTSIDTVEKAFFMPVCKASTHTACAMDPEKLPESGCASHRDSPVEASEEAEDRLFLYAMLEHQKRVNEREASLLGDVQGLQARHRRVPAATRCKMTLKQGNKACTQQCPW